MRNIRKTITVREVDVIMYDRASKEERTERHTISEVEKLPALPENCTLLELSEVEGTQREVIFSMTPEIFVANATIVEK